MPLRPASAPRKSGRSLIKNSESEDGYTRLQEVEDGSGTKYFAVKPTDLEEVDDGSGTKYYVVKPTNVETGGAKQMDDEDTLAITLSNDAYDAVVGAAFGAIHIALPSAADGTRQYVRLHPIFIFIFCLTLFAVQLTALSCIILNMDLTNVWERGNEHAEKSTSDGAEKDYWKGFDEDPEGQMRLAMRTLMVAVLQMIGIKELLGAMKPMCLVLNPVTWFEFDRQRGKSNADTAFHAWICAPICLVAQFLQFGIVYAVLIVSMSVIIEAKTVKDIVFNGLVVMFLGDLDEFAWLAMSAVFNMDQNYFADFRFQLSKEPEVEKARNTAMENHDKDQWWTLEYWNFWFYRGRGGKFQIAENLIVFGALIYIYIKQALMYVQAIHTGILPVAHDVCSLYRGLSKPQQYPIASMILNFVDFFTLINYRVSLQHTVESGHLATACETPLYKQDPFDKALLYLSWWPKNVGLPLIGILVMFGLPQLLYANYMKLLQCLHISVESNQQSPRTSALPSEK